MHAEYNELHSTNYPSAVGSVDNGPVGWLFTVRFLVTAESIECGWLFKFQDLAVFSNSERDSWSRTSYEVPKNVANFETTVH